MATYGKLFFLPVFLSWVSLPLLFAADKPPVASVPDTPIAIVGGKLLTVTHGVIENGVLVLSNGKIAAVGSAADVKVPAGATVVDAKGMTVYPGLIDAETHLGLTEIASNAMTTDLIEMSDEITPHMHVYDAFHAGTVHIPVARLNGITNAVVTPGAQNSISGQDSFIQLYGREPNDYILSRDVALAMNFGSAQRRLPGEGRGGAGGGGPKYPSTRMGLITQMRQAFLDAQDYERKKKAGKGKDGSFKTDLHFEALLPYLNGEKPVILHVTEGHDLEPAMELAKEFKLKVVLSGLTHAQDVIDSIVAYKVPVIFGSIWELPEANERYDAVYLMPGELTKRGVKVTLAGLDRNLPYEAGYAVNYGMAYDEALKAITLNPAEIFGVADKYGSLDAGKVANIVLANGDPLDVRTDVKQVYINGKAMPMVSRQTELRDAYK